jgi:hypothetical protein
MWSKVLVHRRIYACRTGLRAKRRDALMLPKSTVGLILFAALSSPVIAATPVTGPSLSVNEIINKNVEARGGLEAWKTVQSMTMSGVLGAGGNQRPALAVPSPAKGMTKKDVPSRSTEEIQLPFVMELQRPHKMRFELQFAAQTAVQVYDGANGWKVRPFLNRSVVEPYTAEELRISSMQADLEGPLVDYKSKGTQAELVGTERVENHDAYKVRLTMKDGRKVHVWIDTRTFLEMKIEGQPRRLDGVDHPVEIYYRDYRPVDGLQVPFVLETRVLPVGKNALGMRDPAVPSERTLIEKVQVNPKLDEALFVKPVITTASQRN